jgi:CheY-like chemotaxis protein
MPEAPALRILLIEDDAQVRGVLSSVLVRSGHSVTSAANGAVGLRLWREHGADLVLTDIQMPETDGIEVILQLRTYAPELPVIAMSGGDRSGDLDLLGDARLLGAVALLKKPFSADALARAIAAAVRNSNAGGA